MGQNSSIEWTDHTFNPWIGCAKVSAGCKNCYAETLMDKRYGRVQWGVNGTRSRTGPDNWKQPLRWNKAAEKAGVRARVFCASLADVFEDRPDLVEWRADLFRLIDATPHLDWLLLTKRPENIMRLWPDMPASSFIAVNDVPRPLPNVKMVRSNVWLGTSVEDQEAANERIPHLLRAAHLCTYTFLSCEPLLGPLEFSDVTKRSDAVVQLGKRSIDGIDWVIVGGESGPNARPMHPDWARSLRDQCAAAGVAFLFKQWGEYGTNAINITTEQPVFRQFTSFEHWVAKADTWIRGGICLDRNGKQLRSGKDMMEARDTEAFPVTIMHKVGKHAAGRLLDGTEHNGFPDRQPEAVRA